jgi:hypothetical protein
MTNPLRLLAALCMAFLKAATASLPPRVAYCTNVFSGGEDGVGVGGAAGGLVELGEREGREQLVAAARLLFRDGDGGLEGFPRRRGDCWGRASAAFRRDACSSALRRRIKA